MLGLSGEAEALEEHAECALYVEFREIEALTELVEDELIDLLVVAEEFPEIFLVEAL